MRILILLVCSCLTAPAGVWNGTTSYAVSGSSVSVSSTSTYCAWVYFINVGESTAPRIFATNTVTNFHLLATVNNWQASYNGGNNTCTAITTTVPPTSSWVYVCSSRQASDGGPRIYVGSAASSMAECSYDSRVETGTCNDATETMYVGNRAANDRTWNGSIAHARIYSTTLTMAQMDMLRRGFEPDRAHLLAYWPLEGNPVTGVDAIGANTLTLSNVAASGTYYAPAVRPWAWWASLLLIPWRFHP